MSCLIQCLYLSCRKKKKQPWENGSSPPDSAPYGNTWALRGLVPTQEGPWVPHLYPQIVPPANTVLFSTASLETMTETLIPWDGQQKRVIPGSLLTRATNLKSNSLVRVNLYSNTRTSCRDGLSPSILCRQADLWSYLVPVQLSVHLHFFTFITKSENKQDISPHRIRMKN